MQRQSKVAAVVGTLLFLAIWMLWPFIMYAGHYTFSPGFFTGWLVVSLIWTFVALLVFAFLPLWEGRRLIATIVVGVISGKGGKGGEREGEKRRDSGSTAGSGEKGKNEAKMSDWA
ncbi:urea active transporter [Thecaphora frezii]